MNFWLRIAVLVLAGLSLAGCESELYDDDWAKRMIEESEIRLSGEQVLLSPDQVVCGEKKGLWVINQMDDGTAIGRLTEAGRSVAFSDDVRMGDHKFSNPYIQLHGTFTVKVQKMEELKVINEEEKIAEARISVVVKHACFDQPLPLMGINRGDFSEEAAPRLRLRQRDRWLADQILH